MARRPPPGQGVDQEPRIATTRAADGVTIAYASEGHGPALVHLPGLPFSNFAGEWRIPLLRRAFTRLGASLELIQYDGRGTGHSQRDVADLSFEAMLGDLEAVVDAAVGTVGPRRVAMLGFYHSTIHAIAYAARHPERVSHLILFGGTARGWDPMSGQGTQALLSLIERDWDTFVESIAHAWLGWDAGEDGRLAADWFRTATTPAVARATMQLGSAVDVTDDLVGIRCPTLVLHRDAGVVPREMSESLAEAIPGAEFRLLAGTSAGLFFERADEVVDEIVGFVTGAPRPSTAGGSAIAGEALLSPREREVLRLIARGDSNAEIAGRLGLSINTVERHAANLYRKIDARGRADATAFAIRHGLA